MSAADKNQEPKRLRTWLNHNYEFTSASSTYIPQSQIWNAYRQYLALIGGTGALTATEFISEIHNTFPGTVSARTNDTPPLFIIKGLSEKIQDQNGKSSTPAADKAVKPTKAGVVGASSQATRTKSSTPARSTTPTLVSQAVASTSQSQSAPSTATISQPAVATPIATPATSAIKSNNKRKLSPPSEVEQSREVSPPPKKLRKHQFSTLFNDLSADVILISSDGISFGIRRALLISASKVFELMFSDDSKKGIVKTDPSEMEEDVVIIDMEEPSEVLEKFLRFVDQRKYISPQGSAPTFSETHLTDVVEFLTLADRLKCPMIMNIVCGQVLPKFVDKETLLVWYYAVMFGQLGIAKQAIRAFATYGRKEANTTAWNFDKKKPTTGWRYYNLTDLDLEKYEKIPSRALYNFLKLYHKVIHTEDHSYTFEMFANDFTFK